MKKNLVFSSVGEESVVQRWVEGGEPDFDLVFYYYGDSPELQSRLESLPYVKKVVARKGGKFGNFRHFFLNDPSASQYENFFLADCDLCMSTEKINRLFSIFLECDLWVAQPAYTHNSDIHHQIEMAQPRYKLRYTDFVECSATLLNKFAAEKLVPVMDEPGFDFGWGIDLVYYAILGKPKNKIAVIDAVTCWHPPKKRPRSLEEEKVRTSDALEGFATARRLGFKDEMAKMEVFGGLVRTFSPVLRPPNRHKIVVQSFWVGDSLSPLEQTAINSHLYHGHQFELYTYGPVSGVPSGAIVKDAREFLPEADIFAYPSVSPGAGSYAACSNCFRYKLLSEKGGWWVDMDLICLRSFRGFPDNVLASETRPSGAMATTCCMKMAPKNPLMQHCYNVSIEQNRQTLVWGDSGPRLLHLLMLDLELKRYVTPNYFFCPVNWTEADQLIQPGVILDLSKSFAIHMWHELLFRRCQRDKAANYPDSVYEALRNKFKNSP